MQHTLRTRLDSLVPAVLLILGSAAFLGAGSRHPRVTSVLGPVGSDSYFRAFVEEILGNPHWQSMHLLILAGPVLWALGGAGLVALLPRSSAALAEVGRAALLLAAAVWTFAFVLDGFVAPSLAQTVAAAQGEGQRVALAAFRTNQLTVARLGTVSVVLMAAAVTSFAFAIVVTARTASWRAIVGAVGILVGFWPMLAAARGDFVPGPFTSALWNPTALALGAWFVALASTLLGRSASTLAPPDAAQRPDAQRPDAQRPDAQRTPVEA